VKARLVVLAAVVALAGCGSDDDGGAGGSTTATGTGSTTTTGTTTENGTTTAPQEEQRLLVYLLRGEKIGAAARAVPESPGVGAAALSELLSGPTAAESDAGLATEIPAGTRLLGLEIDDGVATVDLSSEFESGGGSLSMQARVAQVVHTLTQFSTVQSVAFQLDGEPVDSVGGEGVVVDPPVGRADFEDLAPAILLESPAPGETVTSPFRLLGTSNTFEATFMFQLRDANGNELASGFGTATSGSGERGTFDHEVTFSGASAGAGVLKMFEASAEDGSEIHVVEIPVQISP
jgi:germination protein M